MGGQKSGMSRLSRSGKSRHKDSYRYVSICDGRDSDAVVTSYVARPLEELVEETVRAAAGEPMVFFLGAGASAAPPSFLPQPWLIQQEVYRCVAPAGAAEEQRELIVGSLPEIYHEVLLELGGEDTREIWKVLSMWEQPRGAPALAGFDLGPNIVHHLVVYLSWKTERPVVTVNFDNMLERAAENLGLRPDARLTARPGADNVAIWKLHGTVENPRSIRTTLQGITATDRTVLSRIQREFERSSGCLIGYSGRDIDFFPFLCGWNSPKPVSWLSLDLGKTAIERFPAAFVGVDAPAQDWAREVILRLPEEDGLVATLKAELSRRLPSAPDVKAAYEDVVRRQAERIYPATFPRDDPKRLLAQAMTLAALGDNRGADDWTDRYLSQGGPSVSTCRAFLLKSAMAHEFARYADSGFYAEVALSMARRDGLRAQADEAQLRIEEARRMMFLPARLPFARLTDFLTPKAVATTVSMVWQALRLRRRKPETASTDVTPDYSQLRACFEYIEHLVRVGALFQGLLERFLPAKLAHWVLDRRWHRIEGYSYLAGYALGIGNAKKYLMRSGAASDEEEESYFFGVLDLYELAPSPTGTCIHHRDVADDLLAAARSMPPGPEREEHRGRAVRLYEEAIEAAEEAGDPSLQLKVMLGMKEADSGRTWPAAEVKDLIAGVQSPAFTRYEDQILARLTEP